MPPAVQTEISPRFAFALIECLGESRDDARAGGGERVADRKTAAFNVELGAIDAAQGAG